MSARVPRPTYPDDDPLRRAAAANAARDQAARDAHVPESVRKARELRANIGRFLKNDAAKRKYVQPVKFRIRKMVTQTTGWWIFKSEIKVPRYVGFDEVGWLLRTEHGLFTDGHGYGGDRYEINWYLLSDGRIAKVTQYEPHNEILSLGQFLAKDNFDLFLRCDENVRHYLGEK